MTGLKAVFGEKTEASNKDEMPFLLVSISPAGEAQNGACREN